VRLYTVARIHRIAGLGLGGILFLLAFTGFFLDHEDFDFLSRWRIDARLLPSAVMDKARQGFEVYKVDPDDPGHRLAASRQGLWLSEDGGNNYRKTLERPVIRLEPRRNGSDEDYGVLYAASTDGVWRSEDGGRSWQRLFASDAAITDLSSYHPWLLVVEDKRRLWRLDTRDGRAELLEVGPLPRELLPPYITLGRLMRDLHYGRGLFSGDLSLWINDLAALLLVFLAASGFVIYLLTRRLRARRSHDKQRMLRWRRWHSNGWVLAGFVPVLLLLVSGVFLDHPQGLRGLMKETRIPLALLPPVYRDLSTDIWSIDFDGERYRIGNRLGLFGSTDLRHWQREFEGFAWRTTRLGDKLFVSGMGTMNRLHDGAEWYMLHGTPHMPRDVYRLPQDWGLLTRDSQATLPLPELSSARLYDLLLALHDGEFFHPLWVWVNDLATLAALVLLWSGWLKWRHHRRQRRRAGY
jgi:hypothetical protein